MTPSFQMDDLVMHMCNHNAPRCVMDRPPDDVQPKPCCVMGRDHATWGAAIAVPVPGCRQQRRCAYATRSPNDRQHMSKTPVPNPTWCAYVCMENIPYGWCLTRCVSTCLHHDSSATPSEQSLTKVPQSLNGHSLTQWKADAVAASAEPKGCTANTNAMREMACEIRK